MVAAVNARACSIYVNSPFGIGDSRRWDESMLKDINKEFTQKVC
jgi:hypothetical protein